MFDAIAEYDMIDEMYSERLSFASRMHLHSNSIADLNKSAVHLHTHFFGSEFKCICARTSHNRPIITTNEVIYLIATNATGNFSSILSKAFDQRGRCMLIFFDFILLWSMTAFMGNNQLNFDEHKIQRSLRCLGTGDHRDQKSIDFRIQNSFRGLNPTCNVTISVNATSSKFE